MEYLKKVRRDIQWLVEQVKCLKSTACACDLEETALEYDPETGILSSTYVDGETKQTKIELPEVEPFVLGNSDANDAGNGTAVINGDAHQISAFEEELEFFDNPSQNTTVLRFSTRVRNLLNSFLTEETDTLNDVVQRGSIAQSLVRFYSLFSNVEINPQATGGGASVRLNGSNDTSGTHLQDNGSSYITRTYRSTMSFLFGTVESLRMTANLIEMFKPLKLNSVPTGSQTTDQYLTVDSSGNVRKITPPQAGGPYAYKGFGTGYFEIKVPYAGTNFSIKFSVYRHGNGLDEYHVSGYLNNPSGWVQTHVTKTSQSGNATETITLTDNGNAGDFRIYIGDGTLGRGITTLFITEALRSGISGGSSSIGSLNVFPTSVQSTITGTVKGTF